MKRKREVVGEKEKLHPKNPYYSKLPDFYSLRALYPDSFGKFFVKNIDDNDINTGKLDFTDEETMVLYKI